MAASAKKAMVKKMSRMGVASTGLNLGAIYAIFGFLYAIAIVCMMVVAPMFATEEESALEPGELGLAAGIMMVAMPIVFAIMGFAGGAVTAILYNFVAKYTGGMVFEMTD